MTVTTRRRGRKVSRHGVRTERAPRRSNVVRVRLLNSGAHPTTGLTIPPHVLASSGLEIGDKVYILADEEKGCLTVVKVRSKDTELRQRERPTLVSLDPRDKDLVAEELSERVRTLEAEAAQQQETSGKTSEAKQRVRTRYVRADRLRKIVRQFK